VSPVNQTASPRTLVRWRATLAVVLLAIPLLWSRGDSSAQQSNLEPPVRISSNVAWIHETLSLVSRGDAFRGLILARRCSHCHGEEGFSAVPAFPNLAGADRLSFWKQMEDFRSGKRVSPVMQEAVAGLSTRDSADLAAYYSMLPTASDPQDSRAFPQAMQDPSRAPIAIRLILFGDGQRGIPPCQSCHGPVSYVNGAPLLAVQNGSYLQEQLENFASGSRSNDINVRMRSIAQQMKAEERTAVSEYYGAGLGPGVNQR
jgi:cytochrome c553